MYGTYLLTQLAAKLLCNALGDAHGRDTTWLRAANDTAAREPSVTHTI